MPRSSTMSAMMPRGTSPGCHVAQAAFKLAAVPRRIFTHRSGGENEFIAKGFGNGASGFEQRFEMLFGGLLKTQCGFAPVVSVRVAAGQQRRFGNPHAVFVLSDLDFREWNNHNGERIACYLPDVKRALCCADFLPINFPAMAHAMHAHDADDIRNFVNHAIVANANTPVIFR